MGDKRQASGAPMPDRSSGFDGAELETLLGYERGRSAQPLAVALLELRSGEAPDAVRAAADRVLRLGAPWVFDAAAKPDSFRPAGVDQKSWALFRAWSSLRSPRSLQQLGAERRISGQRAGQVAHQVDARLRAEFEMAPAGRRWLVAELSRRLGPVTPAAFAEALVDRLGGPRDEAGVELVLWLAGPYRPVSARLGWLAVDPRGVVAQTATCLAADGGVRRLVDVEAELGVQPDQIVSWLRASEATVVYDLAVSVTGPLGAVVERVLDAHGEPLRLEAVAAVLAEGGRQVDPDALRNVVRNRHFHSFGDRIGLPDWRNEPPAPAPHSSAPPSPPPPRPTPHPAPAPKAHLTKPPATKVPTTKVPTTKVPTTKVPAARVPAAKAVAAKAAAPKAAAPKAAATRVHVSKAHPTKPRASKVPGTKLQPTRPRKQPARRTRVEAASNVPAAGGTRSAPAERQPGSGQQSDGEERLWLWVRVDSDVLRGAEAVVPTALLTGLGVRAATRRTFSSRYGPIVLIHDGAQPMRGSVRAVTLAAGGRDGDTLLLGFAPSGDVAVEVRHASNGVVAPDPAATSTILDSTVPSSTVLPLFTGGNP